MRYRGEFPARTYLRTLPDDMARFLASVDELVQFGKLTLGSKGHFLKGRFRSLFEFKMPNSRALAFIDDGVLVITNAAPKKKKKEQEADYERGLTLRDDYIAGAHDERT